MGGNNEPTNLVSMDIRQHTLAHFILYRLYRRDGDKIAYLMKGGQTELGNIERIKLAVLANRTYGGGFKNWNGEKNPMKNKETHNKSLKTKLKKYGNAGIFSNKHYETLSTLLKSYHLDSKIKTKRVNTLNENISKLNKTELKERFGRFGETNGWYGKKRPGNLAGNYGKSKGMYILIYPNKTQKIYKSFTELRCETNLDEGWIKRNRNNGIYNGKKTEMVGYELKYIQNENYGKLLNKQSL